MANASLGIVCFLALMVYPLHLMAGIGRSRITGRSCGMKAMTWYSGWKTSRGRTRVEGCPVYDGEVRYGKLIRDRVFDFQNGVEKTRTFEPQEGEPEQ